MLSFKPKQKNNQSIETQTIKKGRKGKLKEKAKRKKTKTTTTTQ